METPERYVPAPFARSSEPVDAAFFAGITAPTRFILCRHGQTVANARRVVQGLTDYPLDDTGRAQAAALARWLADRGVDRVLSSPLARAAETAGIVTSRLGFPRPGLREALREIDTGSFSDLSLDEAKVRFPTEFEAFEHLSWEGVPDAERASEVRDRALAAWAMLRGEALSGARCILCVSHGGFLQWLVRVTFGSDSWMPLLPTGNCGVFELLVEPGRGQPPGAKLFWERINFIPPSDIAAVTPVF